MSHLWVDYTNHSGKRDWREIRIIGTPFRAIYPPHDANYDGKRSDELCIPVYMADRRAKRTLALKSIRGFVVSDEKPSISPELFHSLQDWDEEPEAATLETIKKHITEIGNRVTAIEVDMYHPQPEVPQDRIEKTMARFQTEGPQPAATEGMIHISAREAMKLGHAAFVEAVWPSIMTLDYDARVLERLLGLAKLNSEAKTKVPPLHGEHFDPQPANGEAGASLDFLDAIYLDVHTAMMRGIADPNVQMNWRAAIDRMFGLARAGARAAAPKAIPPAGYSKDEAVSTIGRTEGRRKGLTFDDLVAGNYERQKEWDTNGKLIGDLGMLYRATEMAGEAGELCNKVKKLVRERLGIAGSRTNFEEIQKEIGDVVICVALLAEQIGLDLQAAVLKAFNETSEQNKLKTRL